MDPVLLPGHEDGNERVGLGILECLGKWDNENITGFDPSGYAELHC